MCRLIVYVGTTPVSLSDLLIKPSHSITKQSYSCRERFTDGLSGLPSMLNADGFGLGWYDTATADASNTDNTTAPVPECTASSVSASVSGVKRKREGGDAAPRPWTEVPLSPSQKAGVYTSTNPAWNDVNLPRLCEKLSSNLVFAHIRAASLGTGVHIMNCHPFAASRYMFMHNGHIGGFSKLRRRILLHLSDSALSSIKGTTDSEHLFGVFLTEVERECREPHALLSPQQLQHCLLRTLTLLELWRQQANITESSLLNLCVSDGKTVLATRVVLGSGKAASLYFTSGSRWAPRQQTTTTLCNTASMNTGNATVAQGGSADGVEYAMQQTDRREHAVIVASERLTACEEDWLPVPKDHMIVIHPSLAVLRIPVVIDTASIAGIAEHTREAATVMCTPDLEATSHASAERISPLTDATDAAMPISMSSTRAMLAAGTDGIYMRREAAAKRPRVLSVCSGASELQSPGRPQMFCTGRDIAVPPMSLDGSSCGPTVQRSAIPHLASYQQPTIDVLSAEDVFEYDGSRRSSRRYQETSASAPAGSACCGTQLPQQCNIVPASAGTKVAPAHQATSIGLPAGLRLHALTSPGAMVLGRDEDTFGNNTPVVWRPALQQSRTIVVHGAM